MTSYTQPNIINLVPESSILYEPGQFASQYIGTWKANSSTGNTPTAIKKIGSHGNSLFSSPHPLYYFGDFQLEKHNRGPKLDLTYLYACSIMHTRHH